MKLAAVVLAAALMVAPSALAQSVAAHGPFNTPPATDDWPTRDRDIATSRASAAAMGLTNLSKPAAAPPRTPRLAWPFAEDPSVHSFTGHGISNYVDHNPAIGAVQDYTCGTRTYDDPSGYNHAGIDIFSTPFAWTAMDNSQNFAVAAMGGVVTTVQNGQFDRQCGSAAITAQPNMVVIRQDDGLFAYYLHFKNNSIQSGITVGARVEKGQKIAVVGSSGFSTGPHLHFELHDDAGNIIDPMAGACSPGPSLFKHQWAYNDTRVTRIGTSAINPTLPSDRCTTETPPTQTNFNAGQSMYLTVYIRNLVQGQSLTMAVLNPNGSTFTSGSTVATNAQVFNSAYFFWGPLSAPSTAGVYRLRFTLDGQVYESGFTVGGAPAATNPVAASVLPTSRSVQVGSTATIFATLINAGSAIARACTVAPANPIDADFSFQTTSSATNTPTGTANAAADIPAGGAQSFVLSLKPRTGSTAQAVDLPFKFQCLNSDAASIFAGLNTLKLSFEATPVADIIALAATVQGDGYVRVPGAAGTGVFTVAASNIGAATSVTVTPRKANTAMAGNLFICETVPATGACKAALAASVTRTIAAGENTTWGVFLQGAGNILNDPANNRVSVDFDDATGVTRGSTSVAATTN